MRLFLAVPLPDAVRDELGRRAAGLRPVLPPASWPRPESIHLTLAFLGEVEPGRLDALTRSLGAVRFARFAASLGQPGFFPHERRPRVAWVGLQPEGPLDALAGEVRRAVGAAGVAFDEKPFRPHLTLARVKAPWSATHVSRFRAAFAALPPDPFEVSRVVLYESRLSPRGATHEPVYEIVAYPGSGDPATA